MALKGRYAWALKVAQNVHFQGTTDERDGKLYIKGTVATQDQANKIWDAIKTIPEWPNDIVADIKAAGGPASSSAQQPQTYTVKSGDTLSKIAREFLGDPNAYLDIFNANRDQLSDPDKIKPGQVLKIPQMAKR